MDGDSSIGRTKKATAKFEKENYNKILVRFPKGTKEEIKKKSNSVNGFHMKL